ncbi:MAG: acetyl/propionyl/methylcrotonyl-CoA carboxylase subunit alpha [Thermomicrobiales bacterium]
MQRVVVANRGEIARRIFRACRELNIETVAIYAEGEEDARHVQEADDAYRVDRQSATHPYLDIESIITVARRSEADAVHPGYGFLAENPALAEACDVAGIVYVGPPAAATRAMGDKVEARALAAAAGVPIVPGSDGAIGSGREALAWAEKHSFPIAIKAAGGGGGRGFRVAHSAGQVESAYAEARGEAERSFSNATIYAEQYVSEPRHVEIQLFADGKGTVVSLGERECSIQRRHQKLIEETPSTAVDVALRHRMSDAAISLAKKVQYAGAGTVEFLLDSEGNFYFLEMNTRIQVEHTITEMVTGIDLVKEQLRLASGMPLSFSADDVDPRGHAIECRINAEDVSRDFAPAPGQITEYREPSGFGVRIDSAIESGDEISPDYDSMIAKLVVWGRDRTEAIARMQRALADFHIEGVPTTIPFHRAVMRNQAFQTGSTTTAFLVEQGGDLHIAEPPAIPPALSESAAQDQVTRDLVVEVGGRRLQVRVHGVHGLQASGRNPSRPPRPPSSKRDRAAGGASGSNGADLISPVQGTVVQVHVEPGQTVSQGDPILAIEAMKMENAISAHRDGTVAAVHVKSGDSIKIGATLATIAEV